MGISMSISTTVAALLVLLLMGIARTERVNKSSSVGLFWSTAKEEGDLLRWKPEANDDLSDPTVHEEERHLDGGFSSLDGMLQWAIGHSDPAKLKEATLDIQHLSPEDLKQRQMEIKELMEKLNTPSDAKLMKIAIDDLNNLSVPLEDRRRALEELLILVEPIDNANDLHKLGGLTAVIRELDNVDPEIRTISAWILGKASQNNPFVQNQILELGTLAKLMDMARSNYVEEATKALYAISALIRNNLEGQELFYMEAGDMMLQNILSNSSSDIRLRRKSVFLLADLVECQLDSRKSKEPPFFSNHLLLKSVVDLMASADLDLQEKALYAVKKLLLLRSTDALVFKEVCGLDLALQRMREQLQQLIVDDKFKEYAQDMENLRGEVEAIFLGELDKVRRTTDSALS
ncbi:hsp70 nucleotide exchange factor FES1 isoform X1 [Sesamum indicum]|uniref:Hsp70 nucleotide exchange factor FES1 isoform X1 n=1 Tax=Sesamum indicum TaxID=4182 RepID=A0A6I9SZ80_SESIN|nr:hsp70 nucleotide exchange factor FES1 isoform X1 [Sesamum indicum]